MRFLKQGILLKPVTVTEQKNRLVWLAAFVLILWAATAFAEERILKYHSHIRINEDASVAVTEFITIFTENEVYWFKKEFPPAYNDHRFQLHDAAIDGKKAEAILQRLDDDRLLVAVQRNDASVMQPGEHTYSFSYLVDGWISFLRDHDELSWNVTEYEWTIPIDAVSSFVEFSQNFPVDKMSVNASTGISGAKGRDYTSTLGQGGAAFFTTRMLAAREGLQVTVSWPKGLIYRSVVSGQKERILKYHSNITVRRDASMSVTETITIFCANEEIKHGIYRDFPTSYELAPSSWLPSGTRHVPFTVKNVTRNGKPEDYHTEGLGNGVRVYMGSKDAIVPPGEHVYTITYETDRQLGFFADHDELYWNVTGNGWIFPIDEASAAVSLPPTVSRERITTTGYTGTSGSRTQDLASSIDDDGLAHFKTHNPLDKYEGLTIVVSWPKGLISYPDSRTQAICFIKDHLMVTVVFLGLTTVILYYIATWYCVGRDPRKGAIMPIYTPPAGLSPAAVRYILRMECDPKTFVSAIINLAVKGYLTIKDNAGVYTLSKVADGGKAPLTEDEKETFSNLPVKLDLKRDDSHTGYHVFTKFRMSLEKRFERLFSTNVGYVFLGGILSVATLVFAFCGYGENGIHFEIPALFVIGLAFPLVPTIRATKNWVKGRHIVNAIAAGVFSMVFAGGMVWALVYVVKAAQECGVPYLFLFALIVLTSVNVLFYYLLRVRSREGRRIMDHIEGFRLFIAATEEDRMNLLNPPEKTPEVFEKYLPYALAMDLEHRWAEQFAAAFSAEALNAPGNDHAERFSFFGNSFRNSSMSLANFTSSLSGSLSAAVSSSSAAPGSSSGSSFGSGSGGSSGGGGGGGGGGGW